MYRRNFITLFGIEITVSYLEHSFLFLNCWYGIGIILIRYWVHCSLFLNHWYGRRWRHHQIRLSVEFDIARLKIHRFRRSNYIEMLTVVGGGVRTRLTFVSENLFFFFVLLYFGCITITILYEVKSSCFTTDFIISIMRFHASFCFFLLIHIKSKLVTSIYII